MRAWINGEVVDAATVSIADHGFTVGDGIFETLKTISGQPFALTRHLRRLAHSANGMLMTPPDEDRVRQGIAAVMDPDVPLGRLRITVTPGIGPSGSARHPGSEPTLVITHVVASPWPDEATVITVPWPRNERSPISGLKTTSYAENVLALARAQQAGGDEAIFSNTEGDLCEGTGSNLLVRFVGRDRWFTPPLSSGALAGITRELALEWLAIEEREIAMTELPEVEAMILMSSTRDLQAVGRLDGRMLAGSADPATVELQQEFGRRASAHIDP